MLRPLSRLLLSISLAIPLATACAAGAGHGAGAASDRGGAPPLPASDHPLAGSPAPSFDLPLIGRDGRAALSDLRGQVVMLDFWATWCEPCKASFPSYQALQEEFSGRLTVLAISEDDEGEDIEAFARSAGARFPLAWDADKALAKQYRIQGMPTLFLIDQSGLVRNVHAGFRAGDEDSVRTTIASLL